MRGRRPFIVLVVLACAAALLWPSGAGAGASSSPTALLHRVLGSCGLDLRAGFSHCNLSCWPTATGRRHELRTNRLRPRRPASRRTHSPRPLPPAARRRRRSPSSTPTTTRPPRPTWARTGRSTDCPHARPRTAASARSTRAACTARTRPTTQGWAVEISLDLDMVVGDLPELPHPAGRGDEQPEHATSYTAVDTAARLGATEDLQQLRRRGDRLPTRPTNVHYNHPGIADHGELRRLAATAWSTRPPRRTSPRSAAPR